MMLGDLGSCFSFIEKVGLAVPVVAVVGVVLVGYHQMRFGT